MVFETLSVVLQAEILKMLYADIPHVWPLLRRTEDKCDWVNDRVGYHRVSRGLTGDEVLCRENVSGE